MWLQDESLSLAYYQDAPRPTLPPYPRQSPESKNGPELQPVYLNQIRPDWEDG